MGGCASRPKDLDVTPEAVPKEAPDSPVKAEPETAVQEKNVNGGENETKEAEPVVETTEPKAESSGTAEVEEVKTNVTEDKAEVVAEEKKEEEEVATAAATAKTEEAVKEEVKEAQVEEKKEEVKEAQADEKKEDAAPSSEDKKDAPEPTKA